MDLPSRAAGPGEGSRFDTWPRRAVTLAPADPIGKD
jgi:hypothetical protein